MSAEPYESEEDGEGRGPIALLGSGEFLPGMEELDRRLLEGRRPRVVHLPTAAAQESPRRLRHWRDLSRTHFEERLEVEVETLGVLDRHSADDPRHVAMLEGAGLIYLSGGNPGYLTAALRGTAVHRRMLELHLHEDVALAGCSAGASALTAFAPDVRSGEGDPSGLDALPGVAVLPHFDAMRRWRPRMQARFTDAIADGTPILGIDEDTAVLTEDGHLFEVYGRSSVTVLPDTVHPAGTTFRL